MSRALFACPRSGCYAVVDRLIEIRVTIGLSITDPQFVCSVCLEEITRDVEITNGALILERTGRERPDVARRSRVTS